MPGSRYHHPPLTGGALKFRRQVSRAGDSGEEAEVPTGSMAATLSPPGTASLSERQALPNHKNRRLRPGEGVSGEQNAGKLGNAEA